MKVTTIRLPDDLLDDVEALARAEGISVSEWIRRAISCRVVDVAGNQEIRDRLRERIEADARILERLGGDPS